MRARGRVGVRLGVRGGRLRRRGLSLGGGGLQPCSLQPLLGKAELLGQALSLSEHLGDLGEM